MFNFVYCAKAHLTLKCLIYDDLRNSILKLVNLQYPNFIELTDSEQLEVIIKLVNHSSHAFLFDMSVAGSFLFGH